MPEEPWDRITTGPFPSRPTAQVLMLHGGAQRGLQPVDGRSLALRRTRAMSSVIAPRLAAAGVVVSVLRFSVKGWQAQPGSTTPSPVVDAQVALTALHETHPDLPIVLLGHSMGARTAAWVADRPGVVGVVGLAPWFPKDDPVDALAGRHLVAAHGSHDRITSPRHTRRFVERAGEVAGSARFLDMGSLGHYMLTGASRWNRVAIDQTLEVLDRHARDQDPRPDVGGITLSE